MMVMMERLIRAWDNNGSRIFNKSRYKPGENIYVIKLTASVGLYKARLSSWRSGMMVGYDR